MMFTRHFQHNYVAPNTNILTPSTIFLYHRTNDLNNKSVPKQIADYIISQAKSVKSDENCVFASGLTTRADKLTGKVNKTI